MIPLGHGLFAIVDAVDYESLRHFKWNILFKNGYPAHAYRYQRKRDGRYMRIRMHHQLIGKPPHGLVTDHVNGNGLDNRRSNLRQITQRQNMQNGRIRHIKDRPLKPKTSQYKGVGRGGPTNKPWRVRIRVNGKLINLGDFSDEREAASVYNEAAKKYFGEFAALNDV